MKHIFFTLIALSTQLLVGMERNPGKRRPSIDKVREIAKIDLSKEPRISRPPLHERSYSGTQVSPRGEKLGRNNSKEKTS